MAVPNPSLTLHQTGVLLHGAVRTLDRPREQRRRRGGRRPPPGPVRPGRARLRRPPAGGPRRTPLIVPRGSPRRLPPGPRPSVQNGSPGTPTPRPPTRGRCAPGLGERLGPADPRNLRLEART